MQTLREVIAGSTRAHREDAHDLGEAGGLAAAHGTPQVAEEVGRQLLEGLALGRAELLHDEAVVARLGEEAVALAPARLPPARSFRQASGSSNNHPSRGSCCSCPAQLLPAGSSHFCDWTRTSCKYQHADASCFRSCPGRCCLACLGLPLAATHWRGEAERDGSVQVRT